MGNVHKRPAPPGGRCRWALGGIVAALALLAAPQPAPAQMKLLAGLERLNHRLAGKVVDYTHNHGHDYRIFSPLLGMPRDLYIYLPPGYTPVRSYPLILYFHLAAVDEHIFVASNWLVQLDQMIQRGEFPPAIVVCPDGSIGGHSRPRASSHSMFVNGCSGRFQDHVLMEVLPFVMRCYPIRPEREAHALLGVSAGGFGAVGLAIKRRDFFGSVAVLAAPLNLRYSNCDDNYRENFDPATYRWKTEYDPNEIVARFYFGLSRVRAKKYIGPVFGNDDQVEERIMAENPADLLFSTNLQPGQLAIYVNYPGSDNWNFDAQAESFRWLAAQKGVTIDVDCAPGGRHNLRYFRSNHQLAYRWLSHHLLPPTDPPPGS